MKKIDRAKLRGKPLDVDCYKAKTTTHEYGTEDNRCFCLGLYDRKTDEYLECCLTCKAFVNNAEPLKTEVDKKTCDNCTNKYLCLNFNKYGACMGWSNREVFIGLIKLSFGMYLPNELIDDKFKFIERLQNER